jgi:hypothetical protein
MEPQFLFETMLFYNSTPCYYKIFLCADLFIGEPVEHHYFNKIKFPYFIIKKKNEEWITEGFEDDSKLSFLYSQLENHITST